MALALLALLGLGLHEAAHAAGGPAWVAEPSVLAGHGHLDAAADAAPGSQRGAIPHSCDVCGAVLLMPCLVIVPPMHIVAGLVAVAPEELPSRDPRRLRRPPRGPVTA